MRIKCKHLLWVAVTWLMGICTAVAQEGRVVSGTVSDSTGAPVAAATVAEKGTRNSTATDDRGRFSLRVTTASPVLVVSSVGFTTFEMMVGNQSEVRISLQGASGQLTDVVVTALGISRKEKALGYATSTIKAEDITRVASPNFASALYGKAPGVRIGATPGGATSAVNIQIRGINSVTGRSQPLIVLDGIPIRDGEVSNNNYWGDQRLRGNGLLDINPEDVENISILKGASAAALYGSEAVNGVVLITTKSAKGRKGFSVDVNANYNVSKVAYLPRYQNVRGAGAPIHVSNGGQDDAGFIYYDTDGDGVKETRGILGYSINFGPKFDGQPVMAWDGQIRPYSSQGDNYKNFYQDAQGSSINVAMAQASDNASTRFSFTRQDNEGTSVGSKNTKNIANLNTSLRLGKKWTTDLMVNYINQKTTNRPYSIDRMINNFTGMIGRFDNPDWYFNKYKTSLGYRYVTGTNQSLTPDENIKYNGFKNDIGDYVWRIKEHNEVEKSDRVIASMTHNWQIMKDLRLRGRIATDFTTLKTESRQTTEIPLAFGNSGYFGQSQQNNTILYGDVLLTYTKKLTSDLELNLMGGYTATKEDGSYVLRSTNGGLSTENMFDVAASVQNPGGNQWRYESIRDAFIGTINADYKGMLFLEGTIRSDRTSTMHPDRNTYVYPSVNSSFVFSEAFEMPTWINFGKVRASWGIVGNYPDRYLANVAYNQAALNAQYNGGSPIAYTYTSTNPYGNDFIEPEKKNEFEIGLEAKLFNRRLGVDLSYYNAQIKDQILPLDLPGSSGATKILTNIGTLRNKGIEIGITGTPVITKDFRWDIGINYSKNINTVEALTTGSNELLHADYDGNAAQLKSVVGQPMGDFYAHPVATDAKGEKIVNPDGTYKLDANNMVKIGNAMPKAIGGMSNSFTYKGFVLDALIDYRFGGYVMPTGLFWMTSRGLTEESLTAMDKEHGGLSYYRDANGKGVQTDAAQGPNGEKVYNDGMLLKGVTEDGNQNTNVISQAYYYWLSYNWGGPQYSNSRYDLYIVKNSYIKMRELSLGYNLPSNVAKKIGAKNLQVSVFGRNLFYIYRTIKDMDAEQTTAGSRWFQTLNNAGTNPSTRTFGAMVRASF